jgi:hypothetical protein
MTKNLIIAFAIGVACGGGATYLVVPKSAVVALSEEVKTVSYYLEHDTERKVKLEECQNNPGQFRGTPNCVNADSAAAKKIWSNTSGKTPRF